MTNEIKSDCFGCHIHRYEYERLNEKISYLEKEKKALFDELATHEGSSAYKTMELRERNRLAYYKHKKKKQCAEKKNSFIEKYTK